METINPLEHINLLQNIGNQQEQIIKPLQDKNDYKFLHLPNGLEILLIQKHDTIKSALSLTINTGFYDDPEEFPGIAHFLEHMLFMGTKAYPEENHFMNFLSKNSGNTNASTTAEFTTFYFDIISKETSQALNIFSQFFINPLFSPKVIKKEINSVNAEHGKNLFSDAWRLNRILKHISDKNHPFNKFGTGTTETLSSSQIRAKLFEFFDSNYSSDRMKMVFLDTNPEIYQEQIIELFSKIPKRGTPKIYQGMPFKIDPKIENKYFKVVKMIPIFDEKMLHIFWQLPNLKQYNSYKPFEHILHLLGHESKGSISYLLHKLAWASNILVSKYDDDETMMLLNVSISLTEIGFLNIPTILKIVNEYIEMIKREKIQQWQYEEKRTINDLNFTFLPSKEALEEISELPNQLFKYSGKYALYGPYYLKEYDNKFQGIIDYLLKYMNLNQSILVLCSKTFQTIATKKEKWYGIKYIDYDNTNKLGDEFNLAKKKSFKDYLFYPKKNNYIPKSIKSETGDSLPKYPQKITDNSSVIDMWMKSDSFEKTPKILFTIFFFYPSIYKSAKSFLIYSLLVKIINESFLSEGYYSLIAKSSYDIILNKQNLQILLDCYPDNFVLLFKNILHKTFNLNGINLKYYKNDLKSLLKNFDLNPLYDQSLEYLKEKSYVKYFSPKELMEVIDEITVEDLYSEHSKLKSPSSIKLLMQGNINKNKLQEYLSPLLFLDQKVENLSTYIENDNSMIEKLEEGEEELYILRTSNSEDPDSAINFFVEIDFSSSIENLCYLHVIKNMIEEKYFHLFRTQEQVGYVVKAVTYELGLINEIIGLSFIIQSSRVIPSKLRSKIKKFLKDTTKYLKSITTTELDYALDIFCDEIQQKSGNIDIMFEKNWNEIRKGSNRFNINDLMISFIKKIDKESLLKFYKYFFVNKHTRRFRIVELYSSKHLQNKKIDK